MRRTGLGPSQAPRARPQVSAAPLAAVLLGLALVLAPAAPASAHDTVTPAAPAPAAALAGPPAEVRLRLSGAPRQALGEVVVTDGAGAARAVGKPVLDGQDVVQRLDGAGAPGAWRVAYRVVSSDGHPVTGEWPFAVAAPAAAPSAAAAPAAPAAVPANPSRAAPSAGPSPAAPMAASAQPAQVGTGRVAQPSGGRSGPATVPAVLSVLAAVAVAASAGLVVLGRRRRPAAPGQAGDTTARRWWTSGRR